MPKTPKVPRPPNIEDESRGLTADQMQSLMHSDDRASGFGTKGHIDLRGLDAEAASEPDSSRPRAPSLPTDADRREPSEQRTSGPGLIIGVVCVVAIGGALAYAVMPSGEDSTDAAMVTEPEVEALAPEAQSPAVVDDEPEPEEAAAVAKPEQPSESKADPPSGSPEKETQAKASRSSSAASKEPAPVVEGKAQPSETSEVDAMDIARRAAAVQGEETSSEQTNEGDTASVGGAVDEALEDKPKAAKSIDELLDTATSKDGEFEQKEKAEAPAPSGDTPSKADVSKVMARLMPGFRSCAGAQVGVATALVAVKSSGDVVSARISGAPFAGTRQGQCMESVIKQRAEFSAFKKTRFEFRYPIRIDP